METFTLEVLFVCKSNFQRKWKNELQQSRKKNISKERLCQRSWNIRRANSFTVRGANNEGRFVEAHTSHVGSYSSSCVFRFRRWTGGAHQPGDLRGDTLLVPCHLDSTWRPRGPVSRHIQDCSRRTRTGGQIKLVLLSRYPPLVCVTAAAF